MPHVRTHVIEQPRQHLANSIRVSAVVRIVLYDPQSLFLEGLRQLLGAQPDFHVVAYTSDARNLINLIGADKPDVLVIDMALSAGITLGEVVRATQETSPHTKLVVLSNAPGRDEAAVVERLGAHAFVPKAATTGVLTQLIRRAHDGELLVGSGLPSEVERLIGRGCQESSNGAKVPLTAGEQRILKQLATGATNQQIALTLNLSEKTVRNKLCDVYDKLRIQNRTQAALFAVNHGLVEL